MYDFIETGSSLARVASSGALGSLVGLQAVWEEAARRGVRLTTEDERVASLAGLWAAAIASTLGVVPAHDEKAFTTIVQSVSGSLSPFVSIQENHVWMIATAVGAGAAVVPRPAERETAPKASGRIGSRPAHRKKNGSRPID